MPQSVTILVTGVGAPGTRGTFYSLKNNEDKTRIKIIGTDIKEDVIGKYWADSFYNVPAPESEDYISRVNEICSKESVDVIVPQTTRETAVFSRKTAEVSSPVTVSESSAIERANNKFELLKVCKKLGVPIPRYYLSQSLDELIDHVEALGYPGKPVVVKPLVSFGSRGFRVLREDTSWNTKRFLSEKPNASEITLDDLARILSKHDNEHQGFPQLLVTEFLPGKEYTIDAFRGRDASVAIPRLRKEIVNGISFRTSLEFRKDLMEYSLRAATELDLRYAFGFQFKLDHKDVPKVLECNPRVQGTMVASYFSGANVIWMSVREALGLPVHPPNTPFHPSEFYRFWGGFSVSDSGLAEI